MTTDKVLNINIQGQRRTNQKLVEITILTRSKARKGGGEREGRERERGERGREGERERNQKYR